MHNPLDLLLSNSVEKIKLIPQALNSSNVNATHNSLNIFESICSLIPQQQTQVIKSILEDVATNILEKMITIAETNWHQKDNNNKNILDWALCSGSIRVIKIFHENSFFQSKNLSYTPNTFTKNILALHILPELRAEVIKNMPTTLNYSAFINFCNLVPKQNDQAGKSIVENLATIILDKMISPPGTNWNQKDGNNNTILEWGLWSTSTTIMNRLHQNEELMQQLILIEKASDFQIYNFWRVLMEDHISDDFRREQIEKFKKNGFNISTKSVSDLKLNGFESVCNLISLNNNIIRLEKDAIKILTQMLVDPEAKWGLRDVNNNTILDWALWSGKQSIMDVLHKNPEKTRELIDIEKSFASQIHNFWRVLMEAHIPNDFKKKQIEKFEELGLSINDIASDGHTPLYYWVKHFLKYYITKYNTIANEGSEQIISTDQSQIDKFYKIIENFIKFGANFVVKGGDVRLLLVDEYTQISDIINKISDVGKKYLAKTSLKKLSSEIQKLIEKTILEDASSSNLDNNIIAKLGNKISLIKQEILKTQDQSKKKLLLEDFRELKSFVEPIVKAIIKQKSFDPNIKDMLGFSSTSWLGEFGEDFLKACIQDMRVKPDINIQDNNGRSPLHWYSDYNTSGIVKALIENGGNVNDRSTSNSATPAHYLFLNTTGINKGKPKLPTFKHLLNEENKPPFDSDIKMVGNKTVRDLINDDTIVNTPDIEECRDALAKYCDWYEMQKLGEQVDEIDLYG